MGKADNANITSKDLFKSKLDIRQLLSQVARVDAHSSGSVDPARYDEVFRKMTAGMGETQKRLARERKLAGLQWSALEKHPQARRVILISNDRRFQSWGLYKCLLERYRGLAEHNPRAAAEAAELALAVARSLDRGQYGEEQIADFLASALAARGDAKRRLGDLDGALADFEEARENLESGTGDPLDEAELEHLWGLLLRDLGQDEEAERALRRASTFYRRIGDPRLQHGWDGSSPEDGEDGHHHVQPRRHAQRGRHR
jgi:tetratricopeptide (TPR) repeat protein